MLGGVRPHRKRIMHTTLHLIRGVNLDHRTKIIATIGPASRSPETLRQMICAGMNVARLNFSLGSYDDHAHVVDRLRAVEADLDMPITLMQDLQGPKMRVNQLPGGAIALRVGQPVRLLPEAQYGQGAKQHSDRLPAAG